MKHLRETYDAAGYRIDAAWPDVDRGSVILAEITSGKRELWARSPGFAGYAVTINGQEYEFLRSLLPTEKD